MLWAAQLPISIIFLPTDRRGEARRTARRPASGQRAAAAAAAGPRASAQTPLHHARWAVQVSCKQFREMGRIRQYLRIERWVDKLVARLLATAALWVRIRTSLKNSKWATHFSPPKNIQKKLTEPDTVDKVFYNWRSSASSVVLFIKYRIQAR